MALQVRGAAATDPDVGARPGRPRRIPGPPGGTRRQVWLLALGVGALALLARLYRITTVHEVHVDEVSYAEVSRNLALGEPLLIYGTPFHLHPPGFFALLAAVQRALGVEPDLLSTVFQLRPVGAVLGAATCVVLALMLRRVVGVPPAVLAGAYLALDPFANRFDSRLFLEAPAVLMTVTATSCLTAVAARVAAVRHGAAGARPPRGRLLVGAGLAVGAAVLVKEPYALVTAAPVLVLLVTGWALRRRDSLTVLGVAGLCYVGYVAGIALTGQWGPWWREKLSGVRRLLGVDQVTGFNAPGGTGLGARLVSNAAQLGPTYLAIALGGLAAVVWAAWWAHHRRRQVHPPGGASVVVGVWLAVAGAYLAFAVGFGTLEEQTFSLVLTPALCGAALLAAALWARGRHAARAVVAALTAALLVGAGATWTAVHTREDDGYLRLVPWVEADVPAGSRVAVTEDVAQFVLRGVEITTAGTVPELVDRRADYFLVSTALAERGYGIARPSVLAELDGRAPIVFSRSGPGLGQLRLYDVRALTGGSGAGSGAAAAGSGAAGTSGLAPPALQAAPPGADAPAVGRGDKAPDPVPEAMP